LFLLIPILEIIFPVFLKRYKSIGFKIKMIYNTLDVRVNVQDISSCNSLYIIACILIPRSAFTTCYA